MRRLAAFSVIAIAMVTVLAACITREQPAIPSSTASGPSTESTHSPGPGAPPATGTLEVTQEFDDRGQVYTEGSLSFVRLWGPEGAVFDAEVKDDRLKREVPAGRYRIRSYQRPCDGNCGFLDPPTDTCEQPLTIAPDTVTRVHVVTRIGSGCTFELPGTPPQRPEGPDQDDRAELWGRAYFTFPSGAGFCSGEVLRHPFHGVVRVLDPTGRFVVADIRTDSRGHFSAPLARGEYRLRLLELGLGPRGVAPVHLLSPGNHGRGVPSVRITVDSGAVHRNLRAAIFCD